MIIIPRIMIETAGAHVCVKGGGGRENINEATCEQLSIKQNKFFNGTIIHATVNHA